MTDNTPNEGVSLNNELECNGCGAILRFKPGTHNLTCMYCGAENQIFDAENEVVTIEETSHEEYFRNGLEEEERMEVSTIRCDQCGGVFSFEPTVSSGFCPFCDNSIIISGGTTAFVYKPKYVLPFDIDENKAISNYRQWLKNLWFAPNDLKHYADSNDHFTGIYIPYWTYDCKTDSRYSGARGDDYTVQQPVRIMENGKQVTRMQAVTKTRWTNVSGHVNNLFDDILVIASSSVNPDLMSRIRAWDLDKLVPFNEKYLSGFRTESYTVKIEDGYDDAKQKMDNMIATSIRYDIGGDRQRINQVSTNYREATFKQILIPVWISAYRYKGKVYQFVVNGRTGAIAGKRPYSTIKIVSAVITGILLILLILLFTK